MLATAALDLRLVIRDGDRPLLRAAQAPVPVGPGILRIKRAEESHVAFWKFLHIASMFAAVTLLVGGSLFAERIMRTRDRAAISKFGAVLRPLDNLGVALGVAGIAFGLVTAIVGPFDLLQSWLVIAYVLVAVLLVLGPIESAMLRRVFEEASAEGDDDALDVAIADTRRSALTIVSAALYVAIIFVMVTKPGQ